MATLVLTAVGTAVGGPIGGAIGAVIGQSVDGILFAPKARQGPRLGELAVQTSSYGTPIPKLFGTMRVAGTVIWSTDLIERRSTSGGGKGRPSQVDYSYSASFAVALSARKVAEVRRIWADGKLLRGAGGDFKVKTRFRLYPGDEEQAVDPLIAAAEGSQGAPAFRGIAYAMFEELELAEFGNRIPSLTFELVADDGAVTIGAIAASLAPELKEGPGTPALLGYAASGGNVRAAIEEMAELADLSLRDDGAALELGGAAGEPAMLSRGRESGRRELVRRAAGSVAGEVTITYYDAAREHQTGLQRAASGGALPEAQSERRALPAALGAQAAKELAERRLDALRAQRVSATVTCGWACAQLRPGLLLRLEGESGSWRVRRWTLGDMQVKLELVRAGGGAVNGGAASPGRTISQADLPHGPTILRLYDLPLAEIGKGGVALAALAAGSGGGWRRAELSVSFDGGTSWRDIGGTAAPAVLGTALTALPPGRSALFDRANAVEVELLHPGMELEARDEDALAAGANLALIGRELVQFGAVEALAPRRFRLSRLLRGRRGTEWAAGAHQAGEDFALIEPASVRAIELPPGVGAGTLVQLLASGVADAQPVAAGLVAGAEALRPPAPVHLRAEPTGSGGIMLSWVRRSRLGWNWASASDTPLGEESELYQLELAGAGGSRALELSESGFHYDAAARAADGPGPIQAAVVQLGTHGRSRAAITIID
jgi:hypothetical protein